MAFITEDFLLQNEPARVLYHDYAAKMPLYDFHSHLDPSAIFNNRKFSTITQAWLSGDHYKWRAMRTHGISEQLITGNASDREKFDAWARTMPYCIGNPLYHWTHLELARLFHKPETLLSPHSADEIYQHCNSLLGTDDFSVRSILSRMKVVLLCTTDDPVDSLEFHMKLGQDQENPIRVLPTFRPDKARAVALTDDYNEWIDKLEHATHIRITGSELLVEALLKRHNYFHEAGCRISDHAMEVPFAETYTDKEVDAIFKKSRKHQTVSCEEAAQFQTFILYECAKMDAEKEWTMQLHIGALRNNNSRRFNELGSDTGFDSISDAPIARPLARFLDSLAKENTLPRTILYALDPAKNETIATMLGNFQDGSQKGKMQFGAAWWFNDQKDGIERHLTALSGLGLLSGFVGMSTDSRSFLSFPRHEYFRRILCNMVGTMIAKGELPADFPLIGKIIEDISFTNSKNYLKIGILEPERL